MGMIWKISQLTAIFTLQKLQLLLKREGPQFDKFYNYSKAKIICSSIYVLASWNYNNEDLLYNQVAILFEKEDANIYIYRKVAASNRGK